MDGFEVQSQLAQIRAHVPVVMITGLQTPEARERAIERGATAYLPNQSIPSCCSTRLRP